MSDWDGYARILSELLDYTNTYYHQEPLLDVTNSEHSSRYNGLDFVISTDVLEHIDAPVTKALSNIRSMLKTGGILILSVPYLEGYETIEHFPHLHQYKICDVNGKYVLVNVRADGRIETFENLSFHGGPGSILERRVFGEGDLISMLHYAGFGSIEIIEPNIERIGYVWDMTVENPLHKGRRGKSYVMICRNESA